VLVPVHLDVNVEAFFESVSVCGKANNREDDAGGGVVGADAKNFGDEAGVDVVARGGAGITSEDSKV
jgi:hypothetical protein